MAVFQPHAIRWYLVNWSKPVSSQLKLNMGASVRNGRAFRSWLLRDHEGKMIFAFYKEFSEEDVLMAECLSLLHGLQLCLRRNLDSFQVEVNSQVLV